MAFRLNPEQEKDREKIEKAIYLKINENQMDNRHATYHYPRTAEEWWNNVDTWWPELLSIIHQSGLRFDLLPIFMEEFRGKELKPVGVLLEKMRRERDTDLSSIFQKTWAAMPDHGSVHSIQGWSILCDLCSEDYVLFEEPPNKGEDN